MVRYVMTFTKGFDCELSQRRVGEVTADDEKGRLVSTQSQLIQYTRRAVQRAIVECQEDRFCIQSLVPDILFPPVQQSVQGKGLATFRLQIAAGSPLDKGKLVSHRRPQTPAQYQARAQVEELPPGYCSRCPAIKGPAERFTSQLLENNSRPRLDHTRR